MRIWTDNRDPSRPEKYKYRSFGNAGTWMLENMRARVTPNKKPLETTMYPGTYSMIAIPAYVVPQKIAELPAMPEPDPEKVPSWYPQKGLLYNWSAATVDASGTKGKGGSDGMGTNYNEEGNSEGVKIQGICPDGWHLPSDKEWTLLENEIIRNTHLYAYNSIDISQTDTIVINTPDQTMLAEGSARGSHGFAMMDLCSSMTDEEINKSSNTSMSSDHGGFSAIGTGYYTVYQGVTSYNVAYFASSSQSKSGSIWYRSLDSRRQVATYPQMGTRNAHMFFSVRCKMN